MLSAEKARRRRASNQRFIFAGLLANSLGGVLLIVADQLGLAHVGVIPASGVIGLSLLSYLAFTAANRLSHTFDDGFMNLFFWTSMAAQLGVFGYGAFVADEARPVALLLSMVMIGLLFLNATTLWALLYSLATAATFAFAAVLAPPMLGQSDRLAEDLFLLGVWLGCAGLMSFLVGHQRSIRERLRTQRSEIRTLNRRLRELVLQRFLPPSLVDDVVEGRTDLDDRPVTRTVTVLIVDIVGFTAMTERMRATGVADFLEDFLSHMCDVVFHHGGVVDKFLGDGMMVLFGAPAETSAALQARAAADCALAMHRTVADRQALWRERAGSPLQIRIAIHQGPAAVGYFGTELRTEFTAVGPTVNMAFRMKPVCQPDATVLSGTVADYLDDREVSALGSFPLRGIDEPRQLFTLGESPTGVTERPRPGAVAAGDVHAGYRILRRVGEGAIGTVYEARHEATGERRAVKVLRLTAGRQRSRLLQEGRIQQLLHANHVVPELQMIEVGGRPALVMPLIEGPSLHELLLHHQPSEDEIAALAQGIALAIAEAHAYEVVHRDLKPQNVLLDLSSGQVVARVADFGLARAGQVALGTRTGVFMGTPAYAAPEQFADASRVTGRADVWALGVMLYEMLTGTMPFPETDFEELQAAVEVGVFDEAPLPERWRGLVASMLHPTPKKRPDAFFVMRSLTRLQQTTDALGRSSRLYEAAASAAPRGHVA